ncbi:MAG: methyltransferase domain-containing protein, partial [Cyanobacteria bacterium SZAS-4]|nr:methyltransferase domain-containing protein [Cyanobacteria bacterium SZAS-4]
MTVGTAANQDVAQVTPVKILQTGLAFWSSKTLLSAVELGIFTELAKGAADADSLTKSLKLHGRSNRDFFDALVALGFLKRENGVYSNTPETSTFLDAAKPSYIGGFLLMTNSRLYPSWGGLTEALKTGEPQNEMKGLSTQDLFAQLYSDQERLKGFLSAMTGISLGNAREIAARFDWSKYKTFCDVGTAQGALAVTVAKAHQHLNGIGYDLAAVEPIFNEYAQRNGLSDRLKFASGDFFKDEMPNVDVIVMGHILHDWNLEEKRMLVAKAYKALNPGGAIIVYDAMIDNEREKNVFALLMSLNMLIETPGGFDYTPNECEGWLKEAGFKNIRFES